MARKSTYREWDFPEDNNCQYDEVCIKCNADKDIDILKIDGEEMFLEKGQKHKSGATGEVSFYTNTNNNLRVAVKNYRGCNENYAKETILINLIKKRFGGFPLYFVPCYTVFTENCYFSIMHAKQYDLLEVLNTHVLTEEHKSSIFNQIIAGINELATKELYLTDLKPANILVDMITDANGNKTYEVWLCDVGSIVARIGSKDWAYREFQSFIPPRGNCINVMPPKKENAFEEGSFTFPTVEIAELDGICAAEINGSSVVFLGGFYHQICIMWLCIFGPPKDADFLYKNANSNTLLLNLKIISDTFKPKLPPVMKPYFIDPIHELLAKGDKGEGGFYKDGNHRLKIDIKHMKSVLESFTGSQIAGRRKRMKSAKRKTKKSKKRKTRKKKRVK